LDQNLTTRVPANEGAPNRSAIWDTPTTREVLDTMADLFVAYDRELNIVFVNRALALASRERHGDLVGRNQWDVWPDMRGTVVDDSFQRALSTGLPVRFDYHYPKTDVWVEVDAYPSGEHLLVYFRDVTSLRLAASEAERRGRELGRLLDAIPHIAWATGTDGAMRYINARWREYTGVDGMDLALIRDAIHPEDLPNVMASMSRSRATGVPEPYELRLRRHDGEYRWHRVEPAPLLGEGGEIEAWIGTSTDVHDQVLSSVTLRESEERLRLALESASLASWAADLGSGIASYSEAAGPMFGRPRAPFSLTFDEWAVFVHPEDLEPTLSAFAAAVERGEPYRVTSRLVREDGSVRWISVNGAVTRDADGRPLRALGVLADVTEERELERAIKEGEAQYRQTAEGLPQLVWTSDASGRRDYFNERWVEYTGRGLGNSEDPWGKAIHPDDREAATANWERAVEKGTPFEAEYRLRGRDGSHRWFLGRAIPLRNDEGAVSRWFGTCTDIHDQKEALRALEVANEFAVSIAQDLDLERIVQALTDACTEAVAADFGSFFYNVVNEEGEALMIYTLSGAPLEAFARFGMPRATQVFGPTFRGEGVIRSENIRKDPRYGKMGEPHHGMPKGHLPVVSYLAVPVVSRTGEVIGGLFFGHHQQGRFTHEHEAIVSSFAAQAAVAMDNARLYKQVREMNEELERKVDERTSELLAANERLQGFTYHVSHDLRAPLRAIVATSAMIQDDFGPALPQAAHELLERQADAGRRMGQLVDDLLRLSRVGQQEMVFQQVDVTELARDAAAEAMATHPYTKAMVVVAEDLIARADPRLLRLALLNLIENAVKYSPDGGTVRVGRREDGAFSVSDEGIGMESQYLERIFEPFQRLHRDEAFRGTGIGLANVRQVIERHGGKVWAESEPGVGSTFLFTLPS